MEVFFQFLRYLPYRINPVALRIGPIQIRYYGIMLLIAFFSVYWLILYRVKKNKITIKKQLIDDYFFWAVFFALIGARLGYVLFYDLAYYLKNPLEIILPFSLENGFSFTGLSGMSYHGGLLAVILFSIYFCRSKKINLLNFSDCLAAAVPLGHFFGRIGNFLNGELYGRATSAAWGMYFPADASNLLRHPSQLYQAFFEGLLLFVLLWNLSKKIKIPGLIFSFYLIGYGFLRFFVEFFRQPDSHLGFVLGSLSMGQVFCLVMVLAGLAMFIFLKRKNIGYLNCFVILFIFLAPFPLFPFGLSGKSVLEKLDEAAMSVVNVSAYNISAQARQSQFVIDKNSGKIAAIDNIPANLLFRTGSGVVVGKEGIIVTNTHTIVKANFITVRFYDGSLYAAEPVVIAAGKDMAFIKVELKEEAIPVKISDSDKVEIGQTIYTIGSSKILDGTFSQGRITGLGRMESGLSGHKVDIIETNLSVYEGDSGSPVFDQQGKLIGFVAAAHRRKGKSYIVASNKIADIYKEIKAKTNSN